MCGIVGVVGSDNAVSITLDGLKKLEYRGYDSAGIAVVKDNSFKNVKKQGKIAQLELALNKQKLQGRIAIGHTRWATHGKPSAQNAHPHASEQFCVVHNGIIENYQEIKAKLQKLGVKFISETDSEILPNLIQYHFEKTGDYKKALIATTKEIHGTYGIAVIIHNQENLILVAKSGSPLVVGVGDNANYVASDYYALSSQTNKIIVLDDNEFGAISDNLVEIFDENGTEIKKEIQLFEAENSEVSKEGYDHFMLKEIYEQPRVLEKTIQNYVNLGKSNINLPNFTFDLKNINKITIVACGTSYYAGLCAKYLIEEIAKVEVEVDIASEFRYRSHPFRKDNLMIFVSQSGETADSLAALKFAKENNQKILSIVNAPNSSMAQLSNAVIRTVAGPEIGVASTKAYTAQVSILALLAIELAFVKQNIDLKRKSQLLEELTSSLPKMQQMLDPKNVDNIKKVAKTLIKARHVLYIGRGISQVSAFESALKFRELSYIDAQGIAAGELKHGTIALIDKKMPVIVIAPHNENHDLFEKTLSNAQEVNARGGKITFISDKLGLKQFANMAYNEIEIPTVSGSIQEALLPVITTQLLAYWVALYKGNDVDQPRNLAKSVTVE